MMGIVLPLLCALLGSYSKQIAWEAACVAVAVGVDVLVAVGVGVPVLVGVGVGVAVGVAVGVLLGSSSAIFGG